MLGELIPLALVVALSPVLIIPAVVLVLHTDRPRPTGLAFMTRPPALLNRLSKITPVGAAFIGFGLVVANPQGGCQRVDSQLERVRDWMQREHATVTAAILLVVGVLLTYTGIRAL